MVEIETWGSDWGLASVDFKSLQILALAKFCKIPFDHIIRNNPIWGTIPCLKDNSNPISTLILHDFNKIKKLLFEKGYNCNSKLNKTQLAEIEAYSSLLLESFEPALIYTWWVDEKNYVEAIRKWYSKILPFPLHYYYPGKYQNEAKKRIQILFSNSNDSFYNNATLQDNLTKQNKLFLKAEQCITTLSTRLGDNCYFFGSEPTTLDALVYGYFAVLLKAPLASPQLQNHLKGCTNLVKFIVRITQTYFPNCNSGIKRETTNKPESKTQDVDFPNATRNKIFATIFATIAMFSFAFFHGMINVENIQDRYVKEIIDDDEDQ